MHRARLHWSVAVAVVAVLSAAPVAAAPSAARDARRIYDEATAAFGLGRYAEAAEKYEQAFAIRPDPALLYNAAQAFRLGGNKARALELYRNYVRLYPDGTNAADARTHSEALKKAVEDEQRAAAANPPRAPVAPLPAAAPSSTSAPPPAGARPAAAGSASAMPPPVETTVPAAAPPAAPAPDTNVPMVTRPAQAGDDKPVTKETWFWVTVGVGAVLVGAMVILAVSGGGETYPDPTYGTARGN